MIERTTAVLDPAESGWKSPFSVGGRRDRRDRSTETILDRASSFGHAAIRTRCRDAALTALGVMPVFLRDAGPAGSFFGVPALGPAGVKVGKRAHFREPVADPDRPDPPPNARDTALLDGFVTHRPPPPRAPASPRRPAATPCCPARTSCSPRCRTSRASWSPPPCSGHGYKFASVVGEILADLTLDGGSRLPVGAFGFAALNRKAAAAA